MSAWYLGDGNLQKKRERLESLYKKTFGQDCLAVWCREQPRNEKELLLMLDKIETAIKNHTPFAPLTEEESSYLY